MTVLDQIVEKTRARLLVEQKPDRRAAEEIADRRTPFAFRNAIGDASRPRIIAEIKSASPSAGSIVDDPDIERIAADYRRGGAAAISIVTEPEFFRGSREWVARARAASELPVVMKDFVVDPSQIVRGIAAGADAILLLASLLDVVQLRDYIALLEAYGCDALVEVHDAGELENALSAGAKIVGVNNRNLRDFSVDLGTSERLATAIPEGIVRVAESGIHCAADVRRLRRAGFHAFLVGESLLRQNDRAGAVGALAGAVEMPETIGR